MNPTVLLAQYRVFSERRLHFGWLFWLTIAFGVTVVLAGAAVFREAEPPELWWAVVVGGLDLLLTAVIIHRLRAIEDSYERHMRDIEERLAAVGADVVLAPLSKAAGARTLITVSLLLAGATLMAVGVYRLLVPL